MAKKVYGIALIGCGNMGAAHLDDIYEREDAKIEYVCDTDEERAKRFARRYGAKKTETDYKKVLADKNVDIVIVATYPSTHLAIVSCAIEHGKHIICEKPLADTRENMEKMVKLIKEHPECKVQVGYILRHHKTWQTMAKMIREGAIGHPIVMRMAQNHHTMDWQKYLTLIKETSPVLDCSVHYIDIMRWFTGAEITQIDGIGQRTESDVPEGKYNYGLLTAKLSDGSVAYYEVGWGNTIASDNLKEFVGPCGRIRLTYGDMRNENREEGDLIEYYKYPEGEYKTINIRCERKPCGAQLAALIDMIENNTEATPAIDDVFKSFDAADRAHRCICQNLG